MLWRGIDLPIRPHIRHLPERIRVQRSHRRAHANTFATRCEQRGCSILPLANGKNAQVGIYICGPGLSCRVLCRQVLSCHPPVPNRTPHRGWRGW